MKQLIITNEMKEEIKGDFEKLKRYMGMENEQLPEINFVTTNVSNTAEFKLGNCFYDRMKLSFKEFIVTSKGIINIFTDTIMTSCKYLLEDAGIDKVIRFSYHLLKYVAIHELIHHLQMKFGITVDSDRTEEEIETMCVEATQDFINQNYRGNKIMKELVKLDLCRLGENFGDMDMKIVNRTKREIMSAISSLLDTEIEIEKEMAS